MNKRLMLCIEVDTNDGDLEVSEVSSDAFYTTCPFDEEVFGTYTEICVCEGCYQERAENI